MKTATRILALILMLALCFTFAACGGGSDEPTATPEDFVPPDPQDETLTWGNISVLVPKGFELSYGLPGDGTDKSGCIVMDSHDLRRYCIVQITDKDTIDNEIAIAVDESEAVDIEPYVTGQKTWTGVCYMDGEDPAYRIFSEVDGHYFLIKSLKFDFNDGVMGKILESLTYVEG